MLWIAIILLVVLTLGYLLFGRNKGNGNIQTSIVSKQNLEETVLATGQVVSKTNLSLSFQASGAVRQVLVNEGDKVKAGQLLAALDQSSARANLLSAQGALAQVQASYDKLINGVTAEDIQTSKDAKASAQQDLDNAYSSSLNVLNDSYTKIYNGYTTASLIRNTYFNSNDQQGVKVKTSVDEISGNLTNLKPYIDTAKTSLKKEDIDLAISKTIDILNKIFNSLKIIRDICDEGTYYSGVSSTDKTSLDTQKANINTALTNITSSQNSIASYKVALQEAQSALNLKEAKPRQEDIDLANAKIISAEGDVAAAKATLNNLIIFAPADGTITKVDTKVGEQATALTEVIALEDVGNLHTEANVSEANIASLSISQKIDYTFDALGPDKHFEGTILTINPSSTVISGVVNYKVTGSLENIPEIKPGMTANMSVLVAKKDNVLAVPSSAVINKNNNQYVRVIDDSKNKTYHEVQVQTGMQADGGLIEIISGIQDGQEIITYIKP